MALHLQKHNGFDWDAFFEPLGNQKQVGYGYRDAMCLRESIPVPKQPDKCLFSVFNDKLESQGNNVEMAKCEAMKKHDSSYKSDVKLTVSTKSMKISSAGDRCGASASQVMNRFGRNDGHLLSLSKERPRVNDARCNPSAPSIFDPPEIICLSPGKRTVNGGVIDQSSHDQDTPKKKVKIELSDVTDDDFNVDFIKEKHRKLLEEDEDADAPKCEKQEIDLKCETGGESSIDLGNGFSHKINEIKNTDNKNFKLAPDQERDTSQLNEDSNLSRSKFKLDSSGAIILDDSSNKEVEVKGEEAILHATDFVNRRFQIASRKSDREMNASSWTMDQLRQYISTECVNTRQPRQGSIESLDEKTIKFIRHEMIERSKLLLSREFHFSKTKLKVQSCCALKEYQKPLAEAEIRTFLDILFHRVCIVSGVQMRLEHIVGRLRTTSLPLAKSDYLFLKDGVCLGVAEAKAPFRLGKDSIPQFLIEVLRMQARYENPDLSFFGILTDFQRFVFVELEGQSLIFEHNPQVVIPKQVYVHYVRTWEDLFSVADIILQLFERHGARLERCLERASSMEERGENANDGLNNNSPPLLSPHQKSGSGDVICVD